MPVLIIETKPDGTVLVAAAQQVPPELMEGAESVASIEEASQVVLQVLGAEGGQGGEGEQPAGRVPDESQPGQSGDGDAMASAPEGDEAAMEQGFNKSRRTY